MRSFVAALAIALLAGPAVAQIGGINMISPEKKKTPEELSREQAIDDAYKSTMKKVPDQKKTTNDPWADMRGTSQPTTGQKQGRPTTSSKPN
jgi:hypothetical protein